LLCHPVVAFDELLQDRGDFPNPLLLFVGKAPAVFGVHVEHPVAVAHRHGVDGLEVGFSFAVEGDGGWQGQGSILQLVEVDGLAHFLNLGEDAALFERQGGGLADKATERLRGHQVELAGTGVEKVKSCGIGLQHVAEKIHQGLIGGCVHAGPHLFSSPTKRPSGLPGS